MRMKSTLLFMSFFLFLASCASKSLTKEDVKSYSSSVDIFFDKYNVGIVNEVRRSEKPNHKNLNVLVKVDSRYIVDREVKNFIETAGWYCEHKNGSLTFKAQKTRLGDITLFGCKIMHGNLFEGTLTATGNKYKGRLSISLTEHEMAFLLEKQRYAELKKEAEFVLNSKVFVTPEIIDNSGFYKNQEVVYIEKNLKQDTSKPKEPNFAFNIKIKKTINNFNIKIDRPQFTLPFQRSGYSLKPKVSIESIKINSISPKLVFANSDIKSELHKIEAIFDIKPDFSLSNNTESYLIINTLSFYIDSSILTYANQEIELPPKSVQSIKNIRFKRGLGEPFVDAYKLINQGKITKIFAKNTDVKIGMSFKYTINDSTKTFFKTHEVKLDDLI